MAKRKRKIYSTQRDKSVIETAKYLKRIGVLSPQAKLHGGRYVSQRVLHKTREFSFAKELGYTTFKVSKKTVKRGVNPREVIESVKSKKFVTARGNRVLIPRDRRYREALRRGEAPGVLPVKLGTMEVVPVPLDYFDFVRALEDVEEFDKKKLPDEVFAFSFFGNMGYGSFPDTEILKQQALERYLPKLRAYYEKTGVINKESADEPEGLVVMRLNRADTSFYILSREERDRLRRTQGKRISRKGTKRAKPRSEMHAAKLARVRVKDAARKRERYAKMTAAEYEKYKIEQRARMRAYRARLKDGK